MTSTYARIPRQGRTAQDIANKAGRTVRTAQRWTSEPREVYERRAAIRHEKIRQLREEGLTMREIDEELNIAVGTVHYALSKTDQ